MRRHIENAAYGVLDYAAYPIGMIVVAPVVLHRLGLAEYGIWTVATAAVSTGGIIASGFGDANIHHVARLRGSGALVAMHTAVRTMIGINLALGTLLAIAGWILASSAAPRLAPADLAQQRACLVCLRIASVLMLVRALESVAISTQRAFERYGPAVRVSIAVRLLTLALAAALAYAGHGVASIMEATAALLALGAWVQFSRLRRLLGSMSFLPAFDRDTIRTLCSFGFFSWLQAVAGVIFGQVDRLLLGVSLGAVAVASYALCIQLAQPIFGVASSGLHFLFPYLSGRAASMSAAELRRTLTKVFACNFLLVAAGAALLLGLGRTMLEAWAGADVARAATPILPLIVFGSALLGLSVTGTYALLALGRVRTVAWMSLAAGACMLMMMGMMISRSGVRGVVIARLGYGCSSLLLYVPLLHTLTRGQFSGVQTAPVRTLRQLDEVPRR
jgi:O-antigen/teichoic acid export membrane protein